MYSKLALFDPLHTDSLNLEKHFFVTELVLSLLFCHM